MRARIAVVLSRPSHPGNIGAAARAMKTMGFADLVLVDPRHFPDPDASAMAAGAADLLAHARVYTSLAAALADRVLAVGFSARGRDLSHAPRALREAAPAILDAAAGGPVALVFGNETSGLSNDELGRCQMLATIPANPEYASLNLAAAVQVACYELASAAAPDGAAPAASRVPATVEDIEALFAHWERAMIASGFIDPEEPKRLMERMRRLFARTRLEREETRFLRGMLASFEKAMKR
jgi:tRNA/rRNA methyltransferase